MRKLIIGIVAMLGPCTACSLEQCPALPPVVEHATIEVEGAPAFYASTATGLSLTTLVFEDAPVCRLSASLYEPRIGTVDGHVSLKGTGGRTSPTFDGWSAGRLVRAWFD